LYVCFKNKVCPLKWLSFEIPWILWRSLVNVYRFLYDVNISRRSSDRCL
jgi:hypothetical protein